MASSLEVLYSCGCVSSEDNPHCLEHGRSKVITASSTTENKFTKINKDTRVFLGTKLFLKKAPKNYFDIAVVHYAADLPLSFLDKLAKDCVVVVYHSVEQTQDVIETYAPYLDYDTTVFPQFCVEDADNKAMAYYLRVASIFSITSISSILPKVIYLGSSSLFERHLITELGCNRVLDFNACDGRLIKASTYYTELNVCVQTRHHSLFNCITDGAYNTLMSEFGRVSSKKKGLLGFS